MCTEGPSPSKAVAEGDPGPTAEGHAAAERLSAAGRACAAGRAAAGALSDQTAGAGARVTDFLHEFS